MEIKFELNQYNRNVKDDEILSDILLVSKKLSTNSLTRNEYKIHGKYGGTTVIRKFGTWNSAIEKAGLVINVQVNNSEEELLENILRIWTKLGRQPLYREIEKPLSSVSVATYEKRFGGWRNALESFILWVNAENREAYFDNPMDDIYKHKTKRDINLRLRFMVLSRDNFKCCSCGASPATDSQVVLQVDHIKPWSKGGETVFENLQTLCTKCNYGKSDLI